MTTKTPAQLTVSTTVANSDLYTGYPSGGPMYAITAANLLAYITAGCLLIDGSTILTGSLKAANGTNANPSITFGSDTGAGLYRVSANVLGIAAGGVQVGAFSTVGLTGNVVGNLDGIVGATTPAAATVTTLTANGLATFSAGANLVPAAVPATTSVGYLGLPPLAKSGDYTLTMAETGHEIVMTGSGHTVTIPANASVAFPLGTVGAASIPSGSSLSLAITTDTLRWIPSNGTGTRTLTGPGVIFFRKYSATEWWCWGLGIS